RDDLEKQPDQLADRRARSKTVSETNHSSRHVRMNEVRRQNRGHTHIELRFERDQVVTGKTDEAADRARLDSDCSVRQPSQIRSLKIAVIDVRRIAFLGTYLKHVAPGGKLQGFCMRVFQEQSKDIIHLIPPKR